MKLTDIKNLKKYLILSSVLITCCYGLLIFAITYSFFLNPFPRYYIYILVVFGLFTIYMTYLLLNELIFKWKKILKSEIEFKTGTITHIQPGSTSISNAPLVKIDGNTLELRGFYNKKDYVTDGQSVKVAISKEYNIAIALEDNK